MWYFTIIDQYRNCSISIKANNGSITSPNYPDPYPRNIICRYSLEVDPKYAISVTIDDLQLQQSYNRQCSSDFLAIYHHQYDKIDRILKCDDILGKAITFQSVTNKMVIQFSSDALYSYKGFNVSFKTGIDIAICIIISRSNYTFY